jgi:hypothetical protein
MMNKLAIPLSLAAAVTLAACGSQEVRTSNSESVPYASSADSTPLRAGSGKVAYVVDPAGPVNGISTQRLTLHMNDGSMQMLDRRGEQVALGEHVRLRTDNTLRRDRLTFRATE